MTKIYIGLGLYIFVTFALSIYTGRKGGSSSEDFMVGKKGYGSVLTALGMATTLASGFAFIGLVGMGYTLGLVATWQAIFGTVLEFICWYMLAHKLRQLAEKTEVITPIEAMSKLHGDPGNYIKIFGGLLIGIFMVFYLAGQFTAGAKAAEVMNLNPTIIAIVIAALTIAYIFLGGMDAAMWTNAIQGVVMLFSFVVLIYISLRQVGGIGNLFASLSKDAPELIKWNNGRSNSSAIFYIMNYWLGSAAGFLAQPQGIQKFLTIKSDKEIRKSALMSIAFNIIRQLGPVIIGMACRIIYPNLKDPELGIPTLIVDFAPSIMGGILMAGIFAAIMSTAETLLLHSTSEINRNFLQKGIWKDKNISDKQYSNIARIITLVIGIISLIISLYGSSGGVFDMIIFAWTGLFTSVGPALYLGLSWKKCTSWGILAGVLTGIPSTWIWFLFIKKPTGIHEGFSVIVPLLAVIFVSLLTKNDEKEETWIESIS